MWLKHIQPGRRLQVIQGMDGVHGGTGAAGVCAPDAAATLPAAEGSGQPAIHPGSGGGRRQEGRYRTQVGLEAGQQREEPGRTGCGGGDDRGQTSAESAELDPAMAAVSGQSTLPDFMRLRPAFAGQQGRRRRASDLVRGW